MPFNKPHIAFTTENPSEDGKFVTTKRPATRDEMHDILVRQGVKAHKTTGHYGDKPEKSIFVEEPTPEQSKMIHHVAKIHGQDSVIDYVNGKPHVVYVNGQHEGMARPPNGDTISGEQVKTDTPHTEFEEAPHKGVKFSHQYDWGNDSNLVPVEEEQLGKSEKLEKAFIPNSKAQNVASSYTKKKGISIDHTPVNVNLNPEHGLKIANAYTQMKHNPNDPAVKSAYSALANETSDQFGHLINNGLKVSKMKEGQPNPYKTSKDLHNDLANNNHMWYYPTEQGYGENEQHKKHPLLKPSKYRHDGKAMPHNDLFRIVHDYFGHHLTGSSFGPKGEHAAYLAHKKMYSPEATKALASETLGQNSFVNFHPSVAEHNRKNPSQTKFAEQKAGLLPDEIINGDWHT